MIELASLIAARLRDAVPAFLTVDNPAIFKDLLDSRQPVTKLLPACFVLAGAGRLSNLQTDKFHTVFPFVEDQDYELVIIIPHEADDLNHMLTDWNASTLMLAVIKALHGWDPCDRRFPRKLGYIGRDAPAYEGGWAAYPLTFNAKRSVTNAENC